MRRPIAEGEELVLLDLFAGWIRPRKGDDVENDAPVRVALCFLCLFRESRYDC